MVSGVFSIPLDNLGATASTPQGSPACSLLGLREYIGGQENELARAAADKLLDAPDAYNPLVIHGPTATGKTLLLRGLASRWRGCRPDQRLLLCAAVDFARGYAHAIDADDLPQFRTKHRSVGLLALDDLQHLSGKRSAQQELSRTIDALRQHNRSFWATCHCGPGQLPDFEPALLSRLAGGLVLPLQPPAAPARRIILQRLADTRGLNLPPAVIDLLVNAYAGQAPLLATAPQMHHAIQQLEAESERQRQPISSELVSRWLAVESDARLATPQRIISLVARHFQLTSAQLKSPSRQREVVRARCVAMLLTRKLTGASLEQLGKQFGGRDHTTVLYSLRNIRSRIDADGALRETVEEISRQLTGNQQQQTDQRS